MLIIIEEGLATRISENTGTAIDGSSPISIAGRERMWEELCGAWKDDRDFMEMCSQIYRDRSGISMNIEGDLE